MWPVSSAACLRAWGDARGLGPADWPPGGVGLRFRLRGSSGGRLAVDAPGDHGDRDQAHGLPTWPHTAQAPPACSRGGSRSSSPGPPANVPAAAPGRFNGRSASGSQIVLILSISGRAWGAAKMHRGPGPDPGTLTLGQTPETIGDPDGDNGPPQPRADGGHASDAGHDDDHALVASLPSGSWLAPHRRRSHRSKQMMITAMTRIVVSIGQPILTAGPPCSNDARAGSPVYCQSGSVVASGDQARCSARSTTGHLVGQWRLKPQPIALLSNSSSPTVTVRPRH